MELQKIAVGLFGLVVAILVIMLVAVPVIENSMEGESYSGSNSLGLVDRFDVSEGDQAATITRTGARAYTVNSTAITLTGAYIVLSDQITVMEYNDKLYVYDYGNSYNIQSALSGITAFSLAFDGSGGYTWSVNSGTERTGSGVTWQAVPSTTGTWGHFSGNSINATLGTTVIAPHPSPSTSTGPGFIAKLTDGEASWMVSPYAASSSTITDSSWAGEIDASYTETGSLSVVGSYNGWHYTYNDSVKNDSRYFAPIAWTSTDPTSNTTDQALLAIIPILLIIVCVMLAVRMVREA